MGSLSIVASHPLHVITHAAPVLILYVVVALVGSNGGGGARPSARSLKSRSHGSRSRSLPKLMAGWHTAHCTKSNKRPDNVSGYQLQVNLVSGANRCGAATLHCTVCCRKSAVGAAGACDGAVAAGTGAADVVVAFVVAVVVAGNVVDVVAVAARVAVAVLRWVARSDPDYIVDDRSHDFRWEGNLRTDMWVATKATAGNASHPIVARPAPDFNVIRPPSAAYKSPIRAVLASARESVGVRGTLLLPRCGVAPPLGVLCTALSPRRHRGLRRVSLHWVGAG